MTVTSNDCANPFQNVGQVASGDRFVGRASVIERVRAGWRTSNRPANLAVRGNHRIGKTSIVERAISLDRRAIDDLEFVKLTVGDFESGLGLFRALSRDCARAILARPGEVHRNVRADLDSLMHPTGEPDDWYDISHGVRRLFEAAGELGVRFVIVLDEFDRATNVFTRLAEFQLLRNIASEPYSTAGLITISRRPVSNIEIGSYGGSTLQGVLSLSCHISQFVGADVDGMLLRAAEVGVDLIGHRERIVDHAGAHPYLLELLCWSLVDQAFSGATVDVDAAYRAVEGTFTSQFSRMIKNLDFDTGNRGREILESAISAGCERLPPYDLQILDVHGLLELESTDVRLFSRAFEKHLRLSG